MILHRKIDNISFGILIRSEFMISPLKASVLIAFGSRYLMVFWHSATVDSWNVQVSLNGEVIRNFV